MVQCLRFHLPMHSGESLILDWEAKIPHASWPKHQDTKQAISTNSIKTFKMVLIKKKKILKKSTSAGLLEPPVSHGPGILQGSQSTRGPRSGGTLCSKHLHAETSAGKNKESILQWGWGAFTASQSPAPSSGDSREPHNSVSCRNCRPESSFSCPLWGCMS